MIWQREPAVRTKCFRFAVTIFARATDRRRQTIVKAEFSKDVCETCGMRKFYFNTIVDLANCSF